MIDDEIHAVRLWIASAPNLKLKRQGIVDAGRDYQTVTAAVRKFHRQLLEELSRLEDKKRRILTSPSEHPNSEPPERPRTVIPFRPRISEETP